MSDKDDKMRELEKLIESQLWHPHSIHQGMPDLYITESACRAILRSALDAKDAEHKAELEKLRARVVEMEAENGRLKGRIDGLEIAICMGDAPCKKCGYNGPGYYQPDKHPCAAEYHSAQQPAEGRCTECGIPGNEVCGIPRSDDSLILNGDCIRCGHSRTCHE